MRFAHTKIRIPRFRDSLVERSGLAARLSEALMQRRCVSIVAPAGYGKTAALSTALDRLPDGTAAAWVTLEAADNLPRLIGCLAAALESCDPPWRVAPEALRDLVAEPRGLRRVAVEVLNALAATHVPHGVLCLDDLHEVRDPRIFEFLGHLLEDLPGHWTLGLVGRDDPPLSLARLRARRELREFRRNELAMSLEEVRALCAQRGLADFDELARQLHRRTEGWAVGVSLGLDARPPEALASARPELRLARMDQRHLFRFLADEVFQALPSDEQELLLQCCVLSELTSEACSALTGNPRAPQILDDMELRGHFVSTYDDTGRALRIHDLFREFLQDRLRRRHPERMQALLVQAAAVTHDPARRVDLLLRAGEREEAARILFQAAPELLTAGQGHELLALVGDFPVQDREQSPHLAYLQGLAAWHAYQDARVHACMHAAAAGFQARGFAKEARRARAYDALALLFLGRVEEARLGHDGAAQDEIDLETHALAHLLGYWDGGFNGPAEAPARALAELVDLLEGAHAPPELWYRCIPRLYMFVGRTGVNAALRRFVEGGRRRCDASHPQLDAALTVLDAWLLLWAGQLREAEAAVVRLREDERWLGQPDGLRLSLLHVQATCCAVRGDAQGAAAVWGALPWSTGDAEAAAEVVLRCLIVVATSAGMLGDTPGLRGALERIRAIVGVDDMEHLRPIVRAWQGNQAYFAGRREECRAILRDLLQISAAIDRMGLDAGVRLLLARVELDLCNPDAATAVLVPLLVRLRSQGPTIDLLVIGPATLEALAAVRWDDPCITDALGEAAAYFELLRRRPAEPPPPPPHAVSFAEAARGVFDQDPHLSARELEVLLLLAQGKSNKLIARALNLSPHTVKRHVARILARLDARSRGQAAAWYLRQTRGSPPAPAAANDAAPRPSGE